MRAYDYNDWAAPHLMEQQFTLYPDGEENAHVDLYEPKDTDIVLVDNDSVTVIARGFGYDWLKDFEMKVYLRNKTDKTLIFSADNGSLNGFACNPFWGAEVLPGSQTFSSVSWSKSKLEENEITTVEEVEVELRAVVFNDWTAPEVFSELVRLNP